MLIESLATIFPSHNFDWKASGTSIMGFCPFHHDKHHRSFSVYTDAKGKERWHCFAESIGGTEIDAVLRSNHEGTNTYEGANRWLVQHGLLQETEQQVKDRKRNAAMYKFYRWTNRLLQESPAAAGIRTYLASRYIDLNTLPHAAIGYYPTIKEVEQWLAENELTDIIGPEVLPERRAEFIAIGSIILFYRTSYEVFSRLKLRNINREKDGNKCTMWLGKAIRKTDKIGYFSWWIEASMDDEAVLVEGEFDVGALASMIYKEDPDAIDPIYCFSGGSNLSSGVSVLVNMGKKNIYLFPDNDGPGIDYSYAIAEQHPQTFIIVPEDYKSGADPASWAADHCLRDLQKAREARQAAFAWIGQKMAAQAAEASLEEQISIKEKFIEYAKKLPATDREMYLKNYGSISGVSYAALLEEVEAGSMAKYRKVLTLNSQFGIMMNSCVRGKNTGEWHRISNVILELEPDIILDAGDGAIERIISIKVSLPFKSVIVRMTPSEYADDKRLYSKIINEVGTDVWIEPKTIPYLRESCNLLSPKHMTADETNEEYVYTHTGWHGDRYLAPNGYIDKEGWHEYTEDRVELPENPHYMALYRLDEPPADLTFIRDVIREHLLKVFDYNITLPYFAHVFWSVIAHFVPAIMPYCLWVVGQTGYNKTTYSGLMASFFGEFREKDFETFRSTKNAIEKNGYHIKDMLYVVDDYKGVDIKNVDLVNLIQSYGDRHGRSRLTADVKARQTFLIRGNMVATAEDVPTGESSVISRIILLKIGQPGDSDNLTMSRKYAYMYPGVMSKFIHFLLNKNIRREDFEDKLAERRKKYRAMHGRVSESLAANSIAWDLVAEFLNLEDLTPQYEKAIENILSTMNVTTRQEQAGFLFIETLSDLIDSGKCYLQGTVDGLTTNHNETATRIGWRTPSSVYILGSLALAEANNFRAKITGSPINYTRNAIYDQLLATGCIIPDGKGRPNKVIKMDGQSVRVLEFKRGVVEKVEETDDLNKPSSGIIRYKGSGEGA